MRVSLGLMALALWAQVVFARNGGATAAFYIAEF